MTYSDLPPAPPSSGYGEAQQRGPRPSTVTNAVRLMYARVALGLIALIVLFATKNDLKKRILEKTPNASQSTIDAALTVGAVIGVVFLVLFALLTLQVNKGKNWARIVTWVIAGLGILGNLIGFAQPAPVATRILAIIELVIDIAIVVLLALRDSNAYFKRR